MGVGGGRKKNNFSEKYVVNALLHKGFSIPYLSRYKPNIVLLSMSNRTQSSLSMPNQWARSRPLSITTWTQASNLSMPNHWARSRQLSITTHKLVVYLTVIKAEYIPTHLYLEIYVTD